MAVQAQEELVLTAPETQNRTPMDLLSLALQKEANIEIIERLAALQERAIAKQAEQSFFRSLHMAQEEAPSVEPNKEVKTSNGKLMYKYASYEQLDKALRPIYIKHGMAIAFSGAEGPAGKVQVLCCMYHRKGHADRSTGLAIDPGAAQLPRRMQNFRPRARRRGEFCGTSSILWMILKMKLIFPPMQR